MAKKEKQKVWLVGLITVNKSVDVDIYGKEKDAVNEFKRRIVALEYPCPRPEHYIPMKHEIEVGLASKAYQYVQEGQTYVITLNEDVVN